MGIKHDILQDLCNLAMAQVRELYPGLRLMFIPHEAGKLHEVVALSEHEVAQHPAGKIALGILEKHNNRELSSFIGLAIHRKAKWLGLSSDESLLALFNINTNEFDNPKDLRRTIYHIVWHAIELVDIRQRPEYAVKFKSGPMVPKRSPMNLARLNIQADAFAAVMSGLQGEENALETLARRRAMDSLSPVHTRRAEDYPFVISLEAARYAYKEIMAHKPARSKYMSIARQLAIEIGHTFDDKSIRRWWQFSEPAQDMAWRNLTPERIIGCAVYTSDDAFVRATGHLISDTVDIVPMALSKLGSSYNAYVNHEKNQILHREIMEQTFEKAIARGLQEDSGQPLVAAANEQNENLVDGKIFGWCANALQAAARAFEGAQSNGISPVQAARLEFEGTKDTTTWDTLKKIGETIIEQKRQGFAVTLGSIAEICNNAPAYATVLGSVRITMKDPNYIQKLEAANDLALRGPSAAPSATPSAAPSAAPKTPQPNSPVYAGTPGFSAPGMGLGGGGSNAAARHQASLERLRQQQGEGADKQE